MNEKPTGPLRHLAHELAQLKEAGRLRERPPAADGSGANALNLCSNDYLGYRTTGRLKGYVTAAADSDPPGAGASRLVCGEHGSHGRLERALASWVGTEASIVFTSGYAANVGLIGALAGEGDLIVSDALNHASIVDGCRLSRARVVVAPHLDVAAVEQALRGNVAKRRWVVTESYFSMDGDSADLRALRRVCDDHDAALVIDESHGMGVFGAGGRGKAAEFGVRADVLMGTLGKALGAQGAFVAGSEILCRWLWNRARSFVFSTGLSPLLATVALGSVSEAIADDGARERLAAVGDRLRRGLADLGVHVLSEQGPILPIVVGQEELAMAWSRRLHAHGVWVQAIRPPTVPPGGSRLRLTSRANLTDGEIEWALQAFRKATAP